MLNRGLLKLVMAVAVVVCAVSFSGMARAESRSLTGGEKAGLGCAVAFGTATTAAVLAGPTETLLLIVGGMLVPGNTSLLMIGLYGTLGGMTCGLGAAATPSVLWFLEQADVASDMVARQFRKART
ncbi:membrane hypothetical protein [uncultured Gammaproteobacteria bacterium]